MIQIEFLVLELNSRQVDSGTAMFIFYLTPASDMPFISYRFLESLHEA